MHRFAALVTCSILVHISCHSAHTVQSGCSCGVRVRDASAKLDAPALIAPLFMRTPHRTASKIMPIPNFLNEMQERLSQLLAKSPAKDIEQNVRALMQQGFTKLDLATREQLDLQAELLARTRARLTELEARVAAIEAQRTEE